MGPGGGDNRFGQGGGKSKDRIREALLLAEEVARCEWTYRLEFNREQVDREVGEAKDLESDPDSSREKYFVTVAYPYPNSRPNILATVGLTRLLTCMLVI